MKRGERRKKRLSEWRGQGMFPARIFGATYCSLGEVVAHGWQLQCFDGDEGVKLPY